MRPAKRRKEAGQLKTRQDLLDTMYQGTVERIRPMSMVGLANILGLLPVMWATGTGRTLDTLAREELGLNPDELGSPWGVALFSFLAFGAGGIVPLLPFLFGTQANAILLATALGLAGLFAVGAALSLFTGRAALWSGLRMVLIGGSAALTTYLIGKWLGVSLS